MSHEIGGHILARVKATGVVVLTVVVEPVADELLVVVFLVAAPFMMSMRQQTISNFKDDLLT